MKENDELLEKRFGKANPFKVPDGYFENLTQNIMDKLPDIDSAPVVCDKKTRIMNIRDLSHKAVIRIVSIAACVCFIILGTSVFMRKNNRVANDNHVNNANKMILSTSDKYIDEAADYAMLDNQDIYACLSSSEE